MVLVKGLDCGIQSEKVCKKATWLYKSKVLLDFMVFRNLPVLLGPYTAMTVVRGVKFFQVIYIVRSWRPKCRAFSCFFRWGCVLCASEDIFNLDEACKVGGPDKLLPFHVCFVNF